MHVASAPEPEPLYPDPMVIHSYALDLGMIARKRTTVLHGRNGTERAKRIQGNNNQANIGNHARNLTPGQWCLSCWDRPDSYTEGS